MQEVTTSCRGVNFCNLLFLLKISSISCYGTEKFGGEDKSVILRLAIVSRVEYVLIFVFVSA